jgi:ribosomal protein L39E
MAKAARAKAKGDFVMTPWVTMATSLSLRSNGSMRGYRRELSQ